QALCGRRAARILDVTSMSAASVFAGERMPARSRPRLSALGAAALLVAVSALTCAPGPTQPPIGGPRGTGMSSLAITPKVISDYTYTLIGSQKELQVMLLWRGQTGWYYGSARQNIALPMAGAGDTVPVQAEI